MNPNQQYSCVLYNIKCPQYREVAKYTLHFYIVDTGGLFQTTLISPRRATGPQKDMQTKASPPLFRV